MREALGAVGRGTDVYLFLTGMMLLSELARREGLFDHVAARAARLADGSATRLYSLVYLVGTVVTVFLSNDATAVVLTPAVAAVVKAARARDPLPYLFICAFIANAASFVLPISNPANFVIEGAPSGEYKVKIEPDFSPGASVARSRPGARRPFPAVYMDEDTSGLKVTVKDGDNHLEPFKLSTKHTPLARHTPSPRGGLRD